MKARRQVMHAVISASVVVACCACWSTTDGEGTQDGGAPAVVTVADPTIACGGVGARSSSVDGHTHDVCVPKSDLASPPGDGASYVTTNANGHAHLVSLESEELSAIQRGDRVRVTTSTETGLETGHVHVFVLARADTLAP